MFNAPTRRSSKRRYVTAVSLVLVALASYAVATAGAIGTTTSGLVEVSETATDVNTRPSGTGTVADPGTQTVQPGEFSVKSKSITKGGATIVATAVFAVVTTAPSTTLPPPTVPPTTAPPVTQPPVPTLTTWPDATNTGVPAGKTLTSSGAFTVTQDGTVVDGLDIDGCLVVRANNVTIQNTRVRQNGSCFGGAIDVGYSNHGIMIRDTEVDGRRMNALATLVGNSGYTCVRCNVHDGGQGFHVNYDVTIIDSYVHDLYGSGDSHNDGILTNGGAHYVIRHNNISCDVRAPGNASTGGGCTGAVVLLGDFSAVSDAVIDNNLLNGGAFALYAGSLPEKPFAHADNIRITDNKFGQRIFPKSGIYGPVIGYEAAAPGNVFSGNTWADSGLPITA
ncbi:MAG: hypothetical protein QOD38_2469 [Acidimicrobiaceae bacterium]